jgi:hypothetical protein
MDQTASANQRILWNQRERREDSDLDRCLGLRARGHRSQATEPLGLRLAQIRRQRLDQIQQQANAFASTVILDAGEIDITKNRRI